MAKHNSYRGAAIDIEMMKFQNQHARALGNAGMNARGDKLGSGGTIIKTREELLAERERQLQLPDYIPEHTSGSAKIQTSSDGFDDSMFEISEEPAEQPATPVQESTEKSAPRRVRAKKDEE